MADFSRFPVLLHCNNTYVFGTVIVLILWRKRLFELTRQ